MSGLLIASQLDEATNRFLQSQLPQDEVIGITLGLLPKLPEQTAALLVRPIEIRGLSQPQPPAGWPFQVQWTQLSSAGIDAYPKWLFQRPVASAQGTATEAIVEYVLAAIFSATKRIPELWVKDSRWSFIPQTPVRGSTLGILGFGSIGQHLAEQAQHLGMQVIASRRSKQLIELAGVETAASLEELFARADHLVIAAPLTEETRGLVGRALLAHAKPGQHLINIARGPLLDHSALLEALDSERLGLATLDVTDPEPLPDGHPLYLHPRVRISPHTSGISTLGQRRIAERFLDNLQRFKTGQPLLYPVDRQRGY
ncbi:phosphoglycerate dehydrogenase-like enzyme [Azomonas agilis]|uniref:Phosphoglycerate dehydrogenase-like enzyme n=1 Tax=Azomonas agilis TaxID=116849 RepID=A0A562IYF7_9GAMM|nr:D-isomer specific 2-hydroxyacid dehydrogenase family protein [Azomonas agilis]TWH75932.1 phosphoglycerate dehydrogenase-like enzyme [Azomonas agilis]